VKIISSKYIYVEGSFLKDSAIVFDNKILEVDTLSNLKSKYPNVEVTTFSGNSVIYPGFINAHTHLEFSANSSTLKYGSFIEWLYSVFENRDNLVEKLTQNILEDATKQMLNSGVTTFGAISSFGADMQICKQTPQRVVYFNEVIGSSAAMVDALFGDFKMRLSESAKLADDCFYPAIAIHSPYSVHPILLREVLKIAKEKNLSTTAHFLESPQEREWLAEASGEFKELFENFFKTSVPVNDIENFLNAFKECKTLFTHCTQATSKELEHINSTNSSVIHCPRSNRLLNCGKLDVTSVENLLLGTDGLSSNNSLSILDELKSALYMHTDIEPKKLAVKLIDAVTTNGADALNLDIGKIKKNFFADFAVFKLPNDLNSDSSEDIALNTIIHCTSANAVYIGGKEVK
jgi:cytosine/adenosine deaminase-related metal-dependent hydrolase